MSLQSGLQKRQNFQEHQKYKSPVTISIREFARTQPKEGWFKVTGVATNVMDAAFRQVNPKYQSESDDGSGTVEKVIIPAYDASTLRDAPLAQVVLITDHLRLRKVVNELQKLGLGKTLNEYDYEKKDSDDSTHISFGGDKEALKKWATKNRDRLIETRTVEGIIRTPHDLELEDFKLYKAVHATLAPQHVVLEEGITPKTASDGSLEIGLGRFLLSIGGIILLFIVGSVVISWRNANAEIAALQRPARTEPYTYAFQDADGNKHTGVDEQTLLTLAREERIPMATLVRIEDTGEIMPVSTIVMLHDRR